MEAWKFEKHSIDVVKVLDSNQDLTLPRSTIVELYNGVNEQYYKGTTPLDKTDT